LFSILTCASSRFDEEREASLFQSNALGALLVIASPLPFGDSVLAEGFSIFYLSHMNVLEIKDKLAALSRREQDEVVAFLFHLRHADDPEYQTTLTRRLEDKEPGHRLSPEQFERELDKEERQ
jgi:hypothetical protein